MKNWIPFIDLLLRLIFGSKQQRDLNRLNPFVELVNLFERTVHDRPDEWFEERASVLQERLETGFSAEEQEEHLRDVLLDAQERLQELSPDTVCDDFADRLRSNRQELSEKYEGDAFQTAIESPLSESSIDGLVDAYRERMEDWLEEDTEAVIGRFKELWDNFVSEAPDEPEEQLLWFLLPEVFAIVREAAHRRLGLRHYDVQILGGIALHEGRITEMKTGEGKTLAATMPLVLNSLTGKGTHLVTVNEYLAKRDSKWMGEIYDKLGIDVGLLQEGMRPQERRPEYEAYITYGTNNHFGFDYLRDNMAVDPEDTVQATRHFAIIDEVDSVLIDEARTPLIISGQAEKSVELYKRVDHVVKKLHPEEDYEVDEKKQAVSLTDTGADKVEKFLEIDNLFDAANMEMLHHVHQAIRAHELYERDSEYVVKDGDVVIVDEFTGRLQPGRRFGEGLHQALEAKEGVEIAQENQTLATITIQNFFRMYDKLSGMTGTADTEAEEFHEIYDLDVVVVPTNDPDIRVDHEDAVYRTVEGKFESVVDQIEHLHENDLPVLVGTVDIEKSERLGKMLRKRNIPHNILNAKNHEQEAAIVAEAGQPGAVTIATNMAGRGTDIVLGDGVIEEDCPVQPDDPDKDPYCPHDPICGLHVIGTERHESRRIDNQLRGRTARQGDPGASRFFVSLQDDVMRLFGSERISGLLESMGMEKGERLEHSWISSSIERAQSKVEKRNFEIRKQLLEYDDVMEKQRRVIYEERRKALFEDDVSNTVEQFLEVQVDAWLDEYAHDRRPARDWPLSDLLESVEATLGWCPDDEVTQDWLSETKDTVRENLLEELFQRYEMKEEELEPEIMRDIECQLLLQVIHARWKEHLHALDNLKQGIQLEGMAQRDPLVEYKRQSFRLFEQLQDSIREEYLGFLFQVEAVSDMELEGDYEDAEIEHEDFGGMESLVDDETSQAQKDAVKSGQAQGQQEGSTVETVVKGEDVGRNDPCPCGSGKKYKYCCGQ
ncbi:MAG: preprotein translocase subunit SecA [bacterium]